MRRNTLKLYGAKCHASRESKSILSSSLPILAVRLSIKSSIVRSALASSLSSSTEIPFSLAISLKRPPPVIILKPYFSSSLHTLLFPPPRFPVIVMFITFSSFLHVFSNCYFTTKSFNMQLHTDVNHILCYSPYFNVQSSISKLIISHTRLS